jgi:hypothetical protein
MALGMAAWRESLPRSARSHASNATTSGAEASRHTRTRSWALAPLTLRSTSKMASRRLTASSAMGEISGAFLPRRALAAMSASSKNLRRAWLQHSIDFPRHIRSDAYLVKPNSVYSDDAGLKKIDVPAPVHLAFYELELADLTFGLAVRPRRGDRGPNCVSVLDNTMANVAIRLPAARLSQASSSQSAFWRIIALKPARMSRASASAPTPRSIAATVIVSALESCSRAIASKRAIVRAEGARPIAPASAFSARLRRALHSLKTLRQPRNPSCRKAHHSSRSLWQPAVHCASSQGRYGSSELGRVRKMSVR